MELVYPYGRPCLEAVFKSIPEDFCVCEELGFEPDGDGEHLLLLIEKTALTTAQLIDRIARDYAVAARSIGYCGLKDRQAVAQQWLSLHLPGKPAPEPPAAGDGYRVLAQARHRRKLRPGTHRTNFFRIRLREVESGTDELDARLQRIRREGFANYFGAQRFGRAQDNVEQALRRLDDKRLARRRRGLLISALRGFLFNRILCRRIESGYWERPLDGDVFMLRGSRSIFTASIDAAIRERFSRLEIASTASLYGDGKCLLSGRARDLEAAIFAEHREITTCLERQGARLQMRALRVAPERFDYAFDAEQKTLDLSFALPPGSYATSLIDHFMREPRSC